MTKLSKPLTNEIQKDASSKSKGSAIEDIMELLVHKECSNKLEEKASIETDSPRLLTKQQATMDHPKVTIELLLMCM